MNGAIKEPCATTKKPPITSMINTMGVSHSFFRTRKNCQSSLSISKAPLLKIAVEMDLDVHGLRVATSNRFLGS